MIMLPCPHRPPCSACPRFAEPGVAAGPLLDLEALARLHGIARVPVISGAASGFRHRARLAIRGRLGAPKIGLFELGTHRVVHVPSCVVHHPLINRVAEGVRRAMVDARLTSYSETAHLGAARYLQVVIERRSQTAQVMLVVNADPIAAPSSIESPSPADLRSCAAPASSRDPLSTCLESIRAELGAELHSLWLNFNRSRGNAILGPEFQRWRGPETVVEHFGGAQIHYPPGAFGQNNLDIAQQIVEHVRRRIPAGARVAEYYAGVGAIGLSVLAKVSSIRMNEVSPHSLAGLERGLAALDSADRAKVTVAAGPASTVIDAMTAADVVVADPPRKGLDSGLIDALAARPSRRFIYVSCGLDSFLADTNRLTASGALRLTDLTAFNLLPYTEHVETVACFDPA
jgi:tRNA/tmRNA/rRNA uracil-C5-methylase (TrmA/RlmC/RlmD family)